MRFRRGAVVALAVASLVSLSACVSTTDAAPTLAPSPPALAPASPTPAPSVPTVTSVVISAATLDIVTDGDRVQSWGYVDGEPDAVEVPALTEVFGFVPARTNGMVPCEGAPCERATASWAGFTLSWYPASAYPVGMFVSTTVARVGDVEITSIDGSSVGDDLQSLSATNPQYVRDLDSPDGTTLQVGVDAVDPLVPEAPFPENAVFVALEGEAPFDTVTTIAAPRQNFGL